MDMKRRIEFSPPDIGEEEIRRVEEVLRSGWLTTGPVTRAFQEELARYWGVPGTVCLSSGTAALELTLRLLGVGPGDEVITSPYTYTATAAAILHVGAVPVLADVVPGGYHLDPQAAARRFTARTKAVLPVDFAGVPCDYGSLFSLAEEKRGLFRPSGPIQERLGRAAVVADCAHGIGGEYEGRPLGSVADFTCFSFHAVKNLTTGEGGAVAWREELLPGEGTGRRLALLSLHGQSRDALSKTREGGWEYDVLFPGYKCNMTDVAAAIGRAQLARYPALLEKRRRLAAVYDEAFRKSPVRPLDREQTGGRHCRGSCHLYPVALPVESASQRDGIARKMEAAGVAVNVHYRPLPLLSAYPAFSPGDFPRAAAAWERELTLPLHTKMEEEDAAFAARCLLDILRKEGRSEN